MLPDQGLPASSHHLATDSRRVILEAAQKPVAGGSAIAGHTARAMSQENVEIVRSIYARWVNGDYSAANWADAEIEFRLFDGRETVGVEALANLWRDFLVTWDKFTNMPDKFLDEGEGRVLVLTRFGGRSKGGGIPITDFPGASLFTLREGKVVRLFLYPDQKEALEAAGLQE